MGRAHRRPALHREARVAGARDRWPGARCRGARAGDGGPQGTAAEAGVLLREVAQGEPRGAGRGGARAGGGRAGPGEEGQRGRRHHQRRLLRVPGDHREVAGVCRRWAPTPPCRCRCCCASRAAEAWSPAGSIRGAAGLRAGPSVTEHRCQRLRWRDPRRRWPSRPPPRRPRCPARTSRPRRPWRQPSRPGPRPSSARRRRARWRA